MRLSHAHDVVRLLAPRIENEDSTKDVDFSASGIRQRWEAGYDGTRRIIEQKPWQDNSGSWDEAKCMIEGMLAEPWHLRCYQDQRLREFLDLMLANAFRTAIKGRTSARALRSAASLPLQIETRYAGSVDTNLS